MHCCAVLRLLGCHSLGCSTPLTQRPSGTHPLSLAQLPSNLVGNPALLLCFVYPQRFLQAAAQRHAPQHSTKAKQTVREQDVYQMQPPCRMHQKQLEQCMAGRCMQCATRRMLHNDVQRPAAAREFACYEQMKAQLLHYLTMPVDIV